MWTKMKWLWRSIKRPSGMEEDVVYELREDKWIKVYKETK